MLVADGSSTTDIFSSKSAEELFVLKKRRVEAKPSVVGPSFSGSKCIDRSLFSISSSKRDCLLPRGTDCIISDVEVQGLGLICGDKESGCSEADNPKIEVLEAKVDPKTFSLSAMDFNCPPVEEDFNSLVIPGSIDADCEGLRFFTSLSRSTCAGEGLFTTFISFNAVELRGVYEIIEFLGVEDFALFNERDRRTVKFSFVQVECEGFETFGESLF